MTPAQRRAAKALREDPTLAERVLLLAEPPVGNTINCAASAVAVIRPLLAGRECEALAVVALDARHRAIDSTILTQGSARFTIVDSAQIYRWALTRKRPCSAVILAHNHPSGDPEPSPEDKDVTLRVAAAGRALVVPLIDHIVFADPDRYVSFAERGLI